MSSYPNSKKSSKEAIFSFLRQISYTKLFKKYSSGNYSFNKISINNLIFNENCLVVARFKDFLIYDDNTDFLRRFYPSDEGIKRLNKILAFYEKYSKIFPNYLVLKENIYLYRNIRKKQKMIDALNELKREEKENRRKLKDNKENEKDKLNDNNELFTKKIKNEIKNYQNNIFFKNFKNSFDTDKNNDDTLTINQNSISIYYKQFKDEDNEKDVVNINSFVTNQTNGSISNIVNVLNDNKIYIKDLPFILAQNSKKNNNKKNKKFKKGNEIKNKSNNKTKGKKDSNRQSIKSINSLLNKEENEYKTNKQINNNSKLKKKKITDKNNLYKFAITSTNATNSSSILSKIIKKQTTSSSLNKNDKDNNDNKNIHHIDNNRDTNSNKKINISKASSINQKKNFYQKTSPSVGNFEFKKSVYKTSYNFKKASLSNNKDKNSKENSQKNKNDNNQKKEKSMINKEIVKKKYIKYKHVSQDIDSNLINKDNHNFLKNKNDSKVANENSNNIIKTENTNYPFKTYSIINNPNLITGDTKSNERNGKHFLEDKVIVNVRDKIKKEYEDKKIYLTAEKAKILQNENLFKLIKTNRDPNIVKILNFKDMKNNGMKTLDNNYINYKKNLIKIKNDNNNMRYNSAFTKQKTEYKFVNKNLLIKDQKAKTNDIFENNRFKNDKNKNELIKSCENINNMNKPKSNLKSSKDSKIYQMKENLYKNKDYNTYNKLYEIKYESTLLNPKYEIKNVSIGRMSSYLSDINKNKFNAIFTPEKKKFKKFKTKNNISKRNYNNKIYLNYSDKLSKYGSGKKIKSCLFKNNIKFNKDFNHNSEKNILSVNILNRIQAVKQNKTKNDFYKIKIKSCKSSYIDKSSNSLNKIKYRRNQNSNMDNKRSYINSPQFKNKNRNFFKTHIGKKFIKDKEETSNNIISSFSIKVNKTHYSNKDKENFTKNKNLKKTWTKI